MRFSLLTNTDRLLLMCVVGCYLCPGPKTLILLIHGYLLSEAAGVVDRWPVIRPRHSDVRERLRSLSPKHQQRKPPTRAQLVPDT